jgi:hypothetical protein
LQCALYRNINPSLQTTSTCAMIYPNMRGGAADKQIIRPGMQMRVPGFVLLVGK